MFPADCKTGFCGEAVGIVMAIAEAGLTAMYLLFELLVMANTLNLAVAPATKSLATVIDVNLLLVLLTSSM
jgi:hypothetical protein